MKLERFEHIGLMVTDMERSLDFYTRVLGLRLRERRPFRSLDLAFLQLGEVELELIAGEDHMRGDAQVNHIAFSVPNLEQAVGAVWAVEPSVEFTDPIELWPGARCLFFRGPDGERLEFVQRDRGGEG